MNLFVTIVLDGVGIGEQPDAGAYGDEGSDTLGNVCALCRPTLPHLAASGLGNIRALDGIVPAARPIASFGKMQEISAGKDSTTGHWELAGIQLDTPFPTYPDGFPEEVITVFQEITRSESILGNRAGSGTAIIDELGDEHVRTGAPIVYTSADSVFQIAAHVDVIPLDDLYEMCRIARDRVCVGEHGVGRVIARPFEGASGAYQRISAARRDFSLLPVAPTLQEELQRKEIRTISIGKIYDLFGGVGFDESHKTESNVEGIRKTMEITRETVEDGRPAFIWVNLVDFDQEYGHRNDPAGFAGSLEEFDRALPALLDVLPVGGRLVLTADHGNDPTTPGTDHSREYVPLLYYGSDSTGDLGTRHSFRDHAATVAAYFGVSQRMGGLAWEEFVRS